MQDRQSRHRAEQTDRDPGHRRIEDPRPLAPPEDQQARRTPGQPRRKREELLPHRNPRHPRIPKIGARRSKAHRRRAHPLTDQPVRQTGSGIRLESQRRDAPQQSSHHPRPGGIAAHPDHGIGMKLVENLKASPHTKRKIQQRPQPRLEAHALQLAYVNQLQPIPRRRNQPGLKAPRRADETHLGPITGPKLVGDRQGRNHMTARASAGDQHTQRHWALDSSLRSKGLYCPEPTRDFLSRPDPGRP